MQPKSGCTQVLLKPKFMGFNVKRAPSQDGGPMTINILRALGTHPKVVPWKFNKSFCVCVRSELSSVLRCDEGTPSLRYLP
jgi:hypothetical protein